MRQVPQSKPPYAIISSYLPAALSIVHLERWPFLCHQEPGTTGNVDGDPLLGTRTVPTSVNRSLDHAFKPACPQDGRRVLLACRLGAVAGWLAGQVREGVEG